MSASNDVGYEIHLNTPHETVLCVDARGVIRGMYCAPYLQYFSPYELWCDEKGVGTVDLAKQESVTAHDLAGDLLCGPEGWPILNIEVIGVRCARIDKALEKPTIVGLDEPPKRPGFHRQRGWRGWLRGIEALFGT